MKTTSETISIIIPTRNRASVLGMCLEALIEQSPKDCTYEILVVDDCSADDTKSVVDRIAKTSAAPIEFIKQSHPLGANAARNLGLDTSSGSVVVFIDDDVIVPLGWLQTLVSGLLQGKHPVASGGVRLTLNGRLVGKHREEVRAYFGEVLSPPISVGGKVVPILCNMVAYRWAFDRARFDPAVRPPMEEVDWLWRAGVTAGFIPDAWVWHYKVGSEIRLHRILFGAWKRGSEGGEWIRRRMEMPLKGRIQLASGATKTALRALSHAVLHLCWGGVVIAVGETSKALALIGLLNRKGTQIESWR